MAVARERRVRWLLWWGLWVISIAASILLLGQLLWMTRELAPVFAHGLDQARPWLFLWRAAVFGMLIGLWPLWVDRLGQHYAWSPAHRAFVLAQRWRVAAWLIVLELVLVQGMLVGFLEAVVR